jgi:hypothetical protein
MTAIRRSKSGSFRLVADQRISEGNKATLMPTHLATADVKHDRTRKKKVGPSNEPKRQLTHLTAMGLKPKRE